MELYTSGSIYPDFFNPNGRVSTPAIPTELLLPIRFHREDCLFKVDVIYDDKNNAYCFIFVEDKRFITKEKAEKERKEIELETLNYVNFIINRLENMKTLANSLYEDVIDTIIYEESIENSDIMHHVGEKKKNKNKEKTRSKDSPKKKVVPAT